MKLRSKPRKRSISRISSSYIFRASSSSSPTGCCVTASSTGFTLSSLTVCSSCGGVGGTTSTSGDVSGFCGDGLIRRTIFFGNLQRPRSSCLQLCSE
uniref:Uncharacterized protein n=1 Tax=Caldiarchaeum subterraneum TaxID=311458 RepID=E6NBG3_CALS0|nr:hypothetical protein HGMM_F21D07C19 [Candidatus Caldarchaeum subterraneum]